MTKGLRFALAGLALTGSAALAQPAAVPDGPSLRVLPDAGVMVPHGPASGFDLPQPALQLDTPAHDAVAGLAPGQDLVGRSGPVTPSLSAAEADSYFATREYQDKNQTLERKGHQSAGKQFANVGKEMAAVAVIRGIRALIDRD